MTFRKFVVGAAALSLLVLGTVRQADAHHSFAMFDHNRSIYVEGTVTKFQWSNPHVFLDVDAVQTDGTSKHYSIECMSVSMLKRAGWNSRTFQPGDKVKVLIAPLLNGQSGGLILKVTMADGKTLIAPVPAANTFQREATE
jgi:Family of unknown function (DUF6152)